jgi:hypothetical protein
VTPRPLTAAAARILVSQESSHTPATITKTKVRSKSPSGIVAEYLIGKHDMAMVYMLPDPHFKAFEEVIDSVNAISDNTALLVSALLILTTVSSWAV